MGKPTGLNEKHWKALELLSDGRMSIKSIAKEIGWSADYLYDLVEGNEQKTGTAGELFSAELRKVDAHLSKVIKSLLKKNKVLAMRLINEVLDNLQSKEKLDLEETRVLTQITNCLAKESPNVEIGNLSFSYVKGLSAEELVHEFNRLRTIASGSSNRGAVQKAFEGRPGILSRSSESGNGNEEQTEDPELRSDAETGEVS
jgi:hypothetical protein